MNIIIIGNFSYPQGMPKTKGVQHFIDFVKKIQRSIKYIIKNPEKTMQIGRSGQQKFKTFFDPKTNRKLLLDLFNSL